MEHKAILRLGVDTLTQRVGIWFYIWKLPLFSGLYTEVVTESVEDYGRYVLPFRIGKDCFATLVQDVEPRLLILRAKNIMIRLDVRSSMLEMVAYDDTAKPVFDLVKAHIQKLTAVPDVKVWPVAYDYHGLSRKLKSAYWPELLCSAFRAEMPGQEILWFNGEDAVPRRGDPPSNVIPTVLMVQNMNGWIFYDRTNDRLLGAGNVPDVWERRLKRS